MPTPFRASWCTVAVAAVIASARAKVVKSPLPWPMAARFDADMLSSASSPTLPDSHLSGFGHMYNAWGLTRSDAGIFSKVVWHYNRLTAKPEDARNVIDVLDGKAQKAFMVMQLDGDAENGNTTCMQFPYTLDKMFNPDWSKYAKYEGAFYWKQRLVHKFSNCTTFLVLAQGRDPHYYGMYYEDALTGLPVGFENSIATIVYSKFEDLSDNVMSDKDFLRISELDCKSPGDLGADIQPELFASPAFDKFVREAQKTTAAPVLV